MGNYQIPKLVLLDVNVERGTYILSHPEAKEELFIKHHDMIFNPDRIIETKIVEAKMKLLHLGKIYDTWIQNLFGEEDLKLVNRPVQVSVPRYKIQYLGTRYSI